MVGYHQALPRGWRTSEVPGARPWSQSSTARVEARPLKVHLHCWLPQLPTPNSCHSPTKEKVGVSLCFQQMMEQGVLFRFQTTDLPLGSQILLGKCSFLPAGAKAYTWLCILGITLLLGSLLPLFPPPPPWHSSPSKIIWLTISFISFSSLLQGALSLKLVDPRCWDNESEADLSWFGGTNGNNNAYFLSYLSLWIRIQTYISICPDISCILPGIT